MVSIISKMQSKKVTFTLSLFFFFFFIFITQCEAQLSATVYDTTCPDALSTIRTSIRQAISREPRMAASLIRLHFHDCFVQGCDASILLDETATIASEKTALPNNNSAIGYHVIETAKRDVESICPGVVSCADILTLAARDASVAVGGPSWQVKLGRRDSTTASRSQANSDIPAFSANLDALISSFARKGLNERDLVALSGSHTIGQAQCVTFRERIYDTQATIDSTFASRKAGSCPRNDGDGNGNLAALDFVTPNSFDNNYFKNLVEMKGLLHSDQVLFNGGSTDRIVSEYSTNNKLFFSDFAASMIKMGDIDPLTGQNGIIRRICSAVN